MESMNFVYFTFFPLPSYRRAKKHFQELPMPPELIKYILEENRSMRTMVWKHLYFPLHPTDWLTFRPVDRDATASKNLF